MIKRIFMVFTVLLMLSTIAVAGAGDNPKKTGGLARLYGLAGSPYVMDPTSIMVNPAWGAVYDNFLWGDLGSTAGAYASGGVGQFAGVNFGVSKNLTLGAIFSRADFLMPSIASPDPLARAGFGVVSILNSVVGGNAVIPISNNFEVMGTYTSGNHSFGIGIAYTGTTNDFNPAAPAAGGPLTLEGSVTQIGINAGYLGRVTKGILVDLGASFILPSATYTPSPTSAGTNESKVSQTVIGVNGRIFVDVSKKLTFVPAVTFITGSGTVDNGAVDPVTSTDLPSVTAIIGGVGANYEVGDFLLTGGLGVVSASITTDAVANVSPELSQSVFTFPAWQVGIEWNLLEWFVGRVGYQSTHSKTTTESTATASTINETIATVSPALDGATVGVGFRFGDFSLDATVNEDVLRQGFQIIGGNGPTFAYMSLSYAIP